MLISCYQCRQQLDVPDDSAGKRVRCPHCQYVIVAPAKARPTESESPALGMPSLELDGDGDRPMTTKVSPFPLPAYDPLPMETSKSGPKSLPPIEELPETPSIERGGRRRRGPMASSPTPVRWGRILGIGAVIGVVVIGVIIGVASSQNNRRRPQQQPMVFNNPPMQAMPEPKMRIEPDRFNPQFPNPNFQAMVPDGDWRSVEQPKHRFKAQFPGQPVPVNRDINGTAMTVFETKWFPPNFGDGPGFPERDWHFTVAHGTLTQDQYNAQALQDRYIRLRQTLCDAHQMLLNQEQNVVLSNVHPGMAWGLTSQNNNGALFARTYFVRDGDRYHHYLLTVKTPINGQLQNGDVNRFFNSFVLLADGNFKQVVYEEIDTPSLGHRRDNEFTVLALHPNEPIAVLGMPPRLIVLNDNNALGKKAAFDLALPAGAAIEQAAVSQDGRYLAVSAAGEIRYGDWGEDFAALQLRSPGIRCAFTREHKLLVASKTDVKEYDPATGKTNATLPIPDLDLKGLNLSAADRTLAVFGDKAIELWDWPGKKLLGRIDAHDAAITAVAFSPDGKTLASASADRTIKLWDVETRETRATLKQHAWTVASLAFTPDGKHLASSGLDGMVLLWNLAPEQPQLVWAESHQFPVRNVAFDRDGKHLYLTCKHPVPAAPGAAKQYKRQLRKIAWTDIKHNRPAAERIVASQAGLHLPTTSVMSYFTPDGARFVTTTDGVDGFIQADSLRIWDTATATVKNSHPMQGTGVLSPDGKWFAYAKFNGFNQMTLLDVQANRVIDNVLTFVPQAAGVLPFVMFTAAGKSLWVQRNHEFVRYEIQTPINGKPKLVQQMSLKLREPNDTRSIHIHAALDHKSFLVELRSQDLMLRTHRHYAGADGKLLPLPKAAPGEWSQHLVLRRVAGSQIELHDLSSGLSKVIGQQRQPMFFDVKAKSYLFAIHPERTIAVSTSFANDQTVRLNLWDLEERKPLLSLPDLRMRSIQSLRFSPDGRYLSMVTGDSWTRIVPTDWLLERKAYLPCPPNDVTGP